MEFRDLDVFVAVVQRGSFTAAAQQVMRTQPAVSMAVARLERELGVRLLERSRGRVRPTEKGLTLLGHARDLLRRRDAARWQLGAGTGTEVGTLRLGTTDAVSAYLFPPVYRAFRKRFPRVSLTVVVDSSAPLADGVLSGELDLAVLTLPAPRSGLLIEPVEEERLLPVVSRHHAWASRRRVRAADLGEEPMIAYPRRSVTRRVIDDALAELGVAPRVDMEMGAPDAMKRLVEVGLGFALLPENLVREDLRRGRLVTPDVKGLHAVRTLGFVRSGSAPLTPAAEAFRRIAFDRLERAKRTP